MLVKQNLQSSIENAIYAAMKSAMTEMLNATTGCVDSNGNIIKQYNANELIETFANKAKGCAGDITNAIDSYIKSATVTLNAGTIMTPLPTGLVSPTGPVTGVITLAVPTVLMSSIS